MFYTCAYSLHSVTHNTRAYTYSVFSTCTEALFVTSPFSWSRFTLPRSFLKVGFLYPPATAVSECDIIGSQYQTDKHLHVIGASLSGDAAFFCLADLTETYSKESSVWKLQRGLFLYAIAMYPWVNLL